MSAPQTRPTTRFGRLEARGILLGLSAAQLAAVAAATTIAVVAVYSAGMLGLVAAAPMWAVLLAIGTVQVGGRPVVRWLPLVAGWRLRRWSGTTSETASTAGCKRCPALRVPGFAGVLDLFDCPELGGCLVFDRRAGTLTGVLAVAGDGFVLDDAAAQDFKVGAWGRVLAGLCQQPSVVRVQVVVRAVPSRMTRARDWWRNHCTAPSDGVAGALARMLDEGFVQPRTRETFVAVAVRAPHRGRRTGANVGQAATVLQGFATSVGGAGLRAEGWLDGDGLFKALRSGLDPYASAHAEGGPRPADLAMGARESWRALTAGTAAHATYWVKQWPRSEVHPAFLQPLLLGDDGERTFTLIAEPLSTARALREIRRAKVEHAADAAQRARIGQVENESTRAEVADLERREAELVAGHSDLRFTGLITVTAPDGDALEQRCTAMETAAAQSMCEVERQVGQQGVAHAAACLLLARGVL